MTKGKVDVSGLIMSMVEKPLTPQQKAKDDAYTEMCGQLFADPEFLPLAVEDATQAVTLYALEKALLTRENKAKDGYQEIEIQGKKVYASKEEIEMRDSIKEIRKGVQEFMQHRANEFFMDNGVCDPKDVPGLYEKLNKILEKNENQIKKTVMEGGSLSSNDNTQAIGLPAPIIAANLSAKSQLEI
jgi:hypothetical protein